MSSDAITLGIPIAVFAVLLLVGFAGCALEHRALGAPYLRTVEGVPSVVSHWLLDETGPPTATDRLASHHDGTYRSHADPGDPAQQTAAAAGVLDFGVWPLVANQPTRKSIQVDGGYVEVPFTPQLNTDAFSFVAWVRTGWTAADTGFYRCVLASRESAGSVRRGYMLYANPSNHWEAWVGDGSAWQRVSTGAPISLGTTDFLAVTHDGTTLTLYVNGEERAAGAVSYAKSTANPLRIGDGAPESANPLFPFVGIVGFVAYFNAALDHQTVLNIGLAGVPSS